MIINKKMVENIYANAMIAHIPVYGMKEISNVDGYNVILEKDSGSKPGEVISYDEAKDL